MQQAKWDHEVMLPNITTNAIKLYVFTRLSTLRVFFRNINTVNGNVYSRVTENYEIVNNVHLILHIQTLTQCDFTFKICMCVCRDKDGGVTWHISCPQRGADTLFSSGAVKITGGTLVCIHGLWCHSGIHVFIVWIHKELSVFWWSRGVFV